MAGASHRELRRSVVLAVCLTAAATSLAGSAAAGEVTHQPLRVLQLNLCGSGIAGCYTGRSVTAAGAVIRAAAPDVVSLNEVCEDHVFALERTLADVHRGRVAAAFTPVPDRHTGGPTRCLNGRAYGIGLLVHTPMPHNGYATYSGIYPAQDLGDPEQRVWLCIQAAGRFYACSTHLASTSPTIALAQCRYLLDVAIPALRAQHGHLPAVVGGDLNLRYGASPDLRPCMPTGYLRLGDDHVQHVLATGEFTVSCSVSIGMGDTTDHPGLLATISMPGTRARASPSRECR